MVLPPGQRAVQGFPRFGVELTRPPPRASDRHGDRGDGRARAARLAAPRGPGRVAPPPRGRGAALRGRLVRGGSGLGGRAVRGPLPAADRTRSRRGCTRPIPRLRRSGRLPLHRHGRGRPGRRRADRRPARRTAADPRARCAGAAGESGPVRVREHQVPVSDRAAPVRTGQPVPLAEGASSAPCAPSGRIAGRGCGAKSATGTSPPGSSARSTAGWFRCPAPAAGESDQSGASVGAT